MRTDDGGPPPSADKERIELAHPHELDAILAIDVWPAHPQRQREIVRESIGARTCYVVRDDARITGFVSWDRGFFNRPYVRLLAIAADARRGGLGTALLARVETEAVAFGELFVSTEERNAPMQAMLARRGYRPSGSIDNVNEPGNLELIYYKRLS